MITKMKCLYKNSWRRNQKYTKFFSSTSVFYMKIILFPLILFTILMIKCMNEKNFATHEGRKNIDISALNYKDWCSDIYLSLILKIIYVTIVNI